MLCHGENVMFQSSPLTLTIVSRTLLFWVYASLNRESYLDYLNGKFEALAKSGSNIDVSVGTNTIGDYAVVLRQDGEQPIYITIKEKGGKIAEACMLPF